MGRYAFTLGVVMAVAFIFPGQGSAEVGMGSAMAGVFPEMRERFAVVSDFLGRDLLDIALDGPADVLIATENAQPAIFALSAACLDVFRKESNVKPDWTAGHSLGEYTALYCAGSLDYDTAARLVCRRGEFIADACAENPGTMAAVLKLADGDVEEICKEASSVGPVVPANFNTPGQIVVSGSEDGVAEASRLAGERGGRAIPLKVSGPFHSPLIAEAGERMRGALADAAVEPPRCMFVANASGKAASQPEVIRDLLYKQITRPVLWTHTMDRMLADGVDTFVEFGHGTVLTGMVKKIAPEARRINVSDPVNLENALRELSC
jgi:[acyl-carrier-protein] S-malonyltransferase